jgi:hypothetical protein
LLQFHIMSGRWVHRQLAPELKDVWTPAKSFYNCAKQKIMASWITWWLEVKTESFIVNLKWRGQAKASAIPPHQNQKITTLRHLQEIDAGTVLARLTCKALHFKEMAVTSASYCSLHRNHLRPELRSEHCVLLSTEVTMPGLILPMR